MRWSVQKGNHIVLCKNLWFYSSSLTFCHWVKHALLGLAVKCRSESENVTENVFSYVKSIGLPFLFLPFLPRPTEGFCHFSLVAVGLSPCTRFLAVSVILKTWVAQKNPKKHVDLLFQHFFHTWWRQNLLAFHCITYFSIFSLICTKILTLEDSFLIE